LNPGPSGEDAEIVSANLAMSDHLSSARRDDRRHQGFAFLIFPEKADRNSLARNVNARRTIMPTEHTRAALAGELHDPMHCQQEALNALLTAGACVALADGRVDASECDEAVSYIERRRTAPGIARARLAELFHERARRLQDRDSANLLVAALRPVAGLPVSSDVIEIAKRVAAADRYLHVREAQVVRLLQLITTTLPAPKICN
jgi:tellurite resistance protein